MKKAVASVLLFVFLFNLVGYKVLFFCLTAAADLRLEAEIAKIRSDDNRLITIRIPLNLPYAPEKTEFEPASGEVQANGTTFRYVMWRIEKGEVELLCISNREESRIIDRTDEFVRKISLMISGNKKKISYKEVHIDFFQLPVAALSAPGSAPEADYPVLPDLNTDKGYPTLPANPPNFA